MSDATPGWRGDEFADEQSERSDPPDLDEPPVQDVLERFHFQCPQCKREMAGYSESCPHCGADLLNVFSATYQPPASATKKLIAWAILIFFVGTMVAAFLMVVRL